MPWRNITEFPTRLLDWTRKPLTAAYFAAVGAAKAVHEAKADPAQRITIWALRRRTRTAPKTLDGIGIEIVYAPRASNPNLHLQSGVFTLRVDDGTKPDEAPDLRTVDELLQSTVTQTGSLPLLREMSMPVTEASKLLRLLRDHFVQAATIYAGYEGVKHSVFETKYRT